MTIASTIYLGWHYVLDDVGELILGALAIGLAWLLTGFDARNHRQPATADPTA